MKIDNSKLQLDCLKFIHLVEEKRGGRLTDNTFYGTIGINKMLKKRIFTIGYSTSLKTLKKITKAIGTNPQDYIINNEE
jgi:hypothetical protein